MDGFLLMDISSNTQLLGSAMVALFAFYRFPARGSLITTIGVYATVSVIFQLTQDGIVYLAGEKYTNLIGDLYVGCETLVLLYLFRVAISSALAKKLLLYATGFYIVVYVSLMVLDVGPYRSNIRVLRDLLLISSAIMYFFYTMKELPGRNLLHMPMFWFASGILFFFSCTFILSLTMEYIASVMRDDFAYYWSFRNFLRAFFCGVLCLGVWQARRNVVA